MRHLYAVRTIDGEATDVLRSIHAEGEKATQRVHDLEVSVAKWNLHREVRVELGAPVRLDDLRIGIPLNFRDAQAPDLFPTFVGRLDLVDLGSFPAQTEIILSGEHHAPLGLAGAVGDHLLIGRTLGPATIQAMLDDIAASVEADTPALP